MKLIVRNKFASLTGASVVEDENGNNLFKVKGKLKLFSPTRKKKVYDMQGNKLYTIRNKYFNFIFHSAYIYNENGEKIAKLKQRFSREASFMSEGEDFEDVYKIGKNPEGRGRVIFRNDEIIGIWRNTRIHFVDTFEVEYEKEENGSLIVALMIAIDNIGDNILDD